MVLITGATGRIGRATVRALQTVHSIAPRVLVRDLERARALWPDGVEYYRGDFEDPVSLAPALEGVDKVLLVSPSGPRQVEWQNNVVRAAGPDTHIVKISGLGTALDSYVPSGRWHAEIEAEIARTGRPYTFFRPYAFMQNQVGRMDEIRESGMIKSAVGRARIAMVDVEDIAAVAARVLSGEVAMHNEAHALTGPAALNAEEVAEIFSAVLGRPVVYRAQTLDELRQGLEQSDRPAWQSELFLSFNRAFAAGQASEVADTVPRALGRPARSLRQCLEGAMGNVAKS